MVVFLGQRIIRFPLSSIKPVHNRLYWLLYNIVSVITTYITIKFLVNIVCYLCVIIIVTTSFVKLAYTYSLWWVTYVVNSIYWIYITITYRLIRCLISTSQHSETMGICNIVTVYVNSFVIFFIVLWVKPIPFLISFVWLEEHDI